MNKVSYYEEQSDKKRARPRYSILRNIEEKAKNGGIKIQEKFEEKLNPYVNCGVVLRIKTQDVGRLEEFINNLFGAKLLYLEKVPKRVRLLIKQEAAGELDNGTTSC